MNKDMITIGMINNRPMIQLVGNVRGESDERLRIILHEMFIESSHAKIVVDLSGAMYIDSHFLGVIVYYHRRLQEVGRELVLLNRSDNPETYINRLIDTTGIDKVLTIVRSEDAIK
jgi:anti-anti-sigma factor